MIAAMILAGPRIILLFPIWLLGVYLVSSSWVLRVSYDARYILVIIPPIVFFIVSFIAVPIAEYVAFLAPFEIKFSRFFVTDYICAIATSAGFVGLRLILDHKIPWLGYVEPAARYLSGFSFTLYILHWPLLCILIGNNMTAGENVWMFLVLIIAVVGICSAASHLVERRAPALRRVIVISLRHQKGSGSIKYGE